MNKNNTRYRVNNIIRSDSYSLSRIDADIIYMSAQRIENLAMSIERLCDQHRMSSAEYVRIGDEVRDICANLDVLCATLGIDPISYFKGEETNA